MNEQEEAGMGLPATATTTTVAEEPKNPVLVALGERVRNLRAQRG